MNKKQKNIGIITKPISKASVVPLSNMLDIISCFSDNTYVITGNEGLSLLSKNNSKLHIFGINQKLDVNIFSKIINHIYMQLQLSSKIIKYSKKVDCWIFFIDSHSLLLPVLSGKLMRNKIIFALAASVEKSFQATKGSIAKVLVYSAAINYKFSDHIILYSPNLIKDWNLDKYKKKISIAHEHFLNFNLFTDEIKYSDRENLVGYVGRLSEEKGILNLIKAIPIIIKWNREIKFLIIGDGILKKEIDSYLIENNLEKYVTIVGWVPHNDLPHYFTKLKLLVLPSYSEGLPNVMLEAMACGTPVLATPVGAILDIIEDENTGFITENNSPGCIARNVIRTLESPILNQISENVTNKIKSEFSYESAVKNYEQVLNRIL
jgi:glycosyltransferase involved in cell wall biosynthesis